MKTKVSKIETKTNGLLNFSDLRQTRFKLLYAGMFIILLIVSLVCILPTLWVALSGFKEIEELYAIPPVLLPKTIDFTKVVNVWNKINVATYFGNSLILIAGCWACDIMINGLAGYVLSRLKPMGHKLIELMVFWAMLLPGISMVPLYMTFVDLPLIHVNLMGSYAPIWLMAGASPFNILLFRNFFNGIPMSYLEAAKIDGCSDMKAFMKIVLPLSKPIIMVESIFIITATWGNFMWPYLLLGGSGKEPVSVLLFNLNGSGLLKGNEYFLLIMISVIPVFIVYAFFSKHIIGGLNMSGIKG